MKRKAIQLAGKTLVVSLPNQWARKYNVRKGDEMEVEEVEKRIVISPQNDIAGDRIEIDVSGTLPMTKRILGALYKAGYDEMNIHFSSPEELALIHEVIREEFVGFEVAHIGKKNVTAREISKIMPSEFEPMLKRMFMIILTMAKDSVEALKSNDKAWLKNIAMMDKDTNKIADFCRRALNKAGYSDFKKTPAMYFIVEQLEKIGDAYRDICSYGAEKKLEAGFILLLQEVNAFFELFYRIFYKFELMRMAELERRRKELSKKIGSAKKIDASLLILIDKIKEATFDMNGPLMVVRIVKSG